MWNRTMKRSAAQMYRQASQRLSSSASSYSARVGTKPQQDRTGNPFARAFEWYGKKLETHPFTTKSITSGTIAGIGDLLCQAALERDEENKEIDYKRSARFVLLAFVFCAPTSHVWYNWLDRTFPGLKFQQVLTRVVVDQFTWTPMFFVIWLSSMWTLEGSKPESIVPRLQESYGQIITSNWALWIPAQGFIFRLVPVKFQVLANNLVDLFWYAFLSFCAAGKTESDE